LDSAVDVVVDSKNQVSVDERRIIFYGVELVRDSFSKNGLAVKHLIGNDCAIWEELKRYRHVWSCGKVGVQHGPVHGVIQRVDVGSFNKIHIHVNLFHILRWVCFVEGEFSCRESDFTQSWMIVSALNRWHIELDDSEVFQHSIINIPR